MSLLLCNARIFRTALDTTPADAILLRDGVVAWIGSAGDAPAADDIMDLAGRTVLPGLTDAHLHLFMLALSRLQVSFARHPVASIPELIDRLKTSAGQQCLDPSDWVQGCDLMEDRLGEGRLPTCADLDPAFPDRPVMLRRYCGHVAVLNSEAMRQLGLGADTPDPQAGTFRRDAAGQLTGIAEEEAAEWVFARAPVPSNEEMAVEIMAIMDECLSYGLTSLTEAAVGFSTGYDREAAVWAHLRATRTIPVRMSFMIQLDPDEAAHRGLSPEFSDEWGSDTLKFFADGIIGGRSGAVSVPYDDTCGVGTLQQPPGVLEDAFARSHAAGWRIAAHATGDRGISRVADAITAAQAGDRGRRHRIEHCFVPPAGLFPQLADENILVVMQPAFLQRMGASIARGLGSRTKTAYPGASVLKSGGSLVFSSDAPTGFLSPWAGMLSAVTRLGNHGSKIGADEALTLPQSLDAYIAGGAYAMRHEKMRGALVPGMAADLVVMEQDPFSVVLEKLSDLHAHLCMVGGRIVYRSG